MEQARRMPHQNFVDFAHSYLDDNACMHLIIPKIKGVRGDVMTYPKTYEFAIKKDWWDINHLPLYIRVDKSQTFDA